MNLLRVMIRLPYRIYALWIIAWSRQFDWTYYRDAYYEKDGWLANRLPLLHYVLLGASRGHHPSSVFDAEYGGTPLERAAHGGNLHALVTNILCGTDHSLYLGPMGRLRRAFMLYRRRRYLRHSVAECMELVRDSGILDPEFYVKTYGDAPQDADTLLPHFVQIGIAEGRYPNALFDPIAYQLKYRDVADSPLPPLIHYLKFGRAEGRSAEHGLDGVLPGYMPDSHHKIQTNFSRRGKRRKLDRKRIPITIEMPDRSDGEWTFDISESGSHVVRVRHPAWYFDRIDRGEPVTFIKRTHGTWDILATWFDNQHRLGTLPLSSGERAHLANRLSYYRAQTMRREAVKYIYVENFQQELVADMSFRTKDENYCHAVSLTGLPASLKEIFFRYYSSAYVAKLRSLLASLVPAGEYHDATLWKRAVGSGAILQLNRTLRDRPVYFVGLSHYGVLAERLGWRDFTHIEIPPSGTMAARVQLLEHVRSQLLRRFGRDPGAAQRPVVLICAGNLAQWLAHRLYQQIPGGVYLDVGMAYSLWIIDIYPTVHGWIKHLPPEFYDQMGIVEILGRAPEEIKEKYRRWMQRDI